MRIHKFIFISLFICLGSSTAKACTCNVFGFCKFLRGTPAVVEARAINSYEAVNSSQFFMDIEITDYLTDADSLAYDTLTLVNYNSSCEPRISRFAEPGDLFVFILSEFGSEPEALFPTFSLDECSITHLVIEGDSIWGLFDATEPISGYQVLAYDYFKDNIDNCGSLLSTSSLPPFAIDLRVFPNPAQDNLVVSTNNLQNMGYTIYSNEGKIMKTGKNIHEPDFTIDISHFSSGLYFIQLQHEDHVFSKKFIKI